VEQFCHFDFKVKPVNQLTIQPFNHFKMNAFRTLYITGLPVVTVFSTVIGINTGFLVNDRQPDTAPGERYANIIGYTGIGFLTGVTYPLSFPLLGAYVLRKG
jgi:hypothetical protein